MNSFINIGIYLTYILFFSAMLIILFFAVKTIVKDFKNVKSSLFGILILLAVFLIAFGISSSSDIPIQFFEKTQTDPQYSKLIGSALISLYLLMVGVIGTLLYVQVSKLFKR